MQNLSEAFNSLNAEQRAAVLSSDNTVVLAGPGSGKTATLVVKIGHLLAETIHPPSGLACVTYNNDAVREFRMRLGALGIYARHNLFLGTVHSFCLNCIVRPYAELVDARFSSGVEVAGPELAASLFQQAANRCGLGDQARWLGPTITRLRRAIACGEDVSGFADSDMLLAHAYEEKLLEHGVIDFEGIVISALHLVSENAWIREILAARFPWLIVDEYQDLGGPLHQIVTALSEMAGIKLFAVGDPDQTIYDFTGADPRYLNDLATRPNFKCVRLRFNYRSGKHIIAASEAALDPQNSRNYEADPNRKEDGQILFFECNGRHSDHASKVVDAVRNSLSAGYKAEEIAIFYRAIGPMAEAIRTALTEASIDFIWERDDTFPDSPFIRWLQRLTYWTLSPIDKREVSFASLYHEFRMLLEAAGQIEDGADSLESRISFWRVANMSAHGDQLAGDWLTAAETLIGFDSILSSTEEYAHDLECYRSLKRSFASSGANAKTRLYEFASFGNVRGKIILTTFHSSKGRQFDVVVIPGCAEGVLPPWSWDRKSRSFTEPSSRVLSEVRRLFYVGLSRARKIVHLIHAVQWEDQYERVRSCGISRFIEEIQARLTQSLSCENEKIE